MSEITQDNLNDDYEEYDEIDAERERIEADRHAEYNEQKRYVTRDTLTMGEILNAPPRMIQAYIPNLAIAGGLSMLSAEPKCGKSTLLFHALGAMTTGKPFLGEPTNHAKVVYAFEQSEYILYDQLKENPVPSLVKNKDIHVIPLEKNGKFSKVDHDEYEQPFVVRQPFTSWNDQVSYWVSKLDEHKAQILVIDTFGAFALLTGGEANDQGIITSRLTFLKQAVFTYNLNTAIIINHHLRKIAGNREPDFKDVANSFGMRAVPDSNLLLHDPKLKDRPKVRKLKVEGRFGLVPDRNIEIGNDGYVTIEEICKAPPVKKDLNDQDVLFNAHRSNPDLENMGQKKVGDKVGVTEHQVVLFRKKYPVAARYFQTAREKGTLQDLHQLGEAFPAK